MKGEYLSSSMVGCQGTSRNGLKVAKAGHKSEGRMGMMADSCDSERLRGGGIVALWLMGIMANRLRFGI